MIRPRSWYCRPCDLRHFGPCPGPLLVEPASDLSPAEESLLDLLGSAQALLQRGHTAADLAQLLHGLERGAGAPAAALPISAAWVH